jgi:hypothetical protein
VLADHVVVADGLVEHERVGADGVPDAGHQVLGRDRAVGRRPLGLGPPLALRVVPGMDPRRAGLDSHLVEALPPGQPVAQLADGGREIRPRVPPGRHLPQRHPLLERVDVDDVDAGGRVRAVVARDPRHVAAQHEDHVRLGQDRILLRAVPLVAEVQRVIVGEVDGGRHRLDHPDGRQVAQPDQIGHGGGVPAQVRGDDQRGARVLQRVRDLVRDLVCQRGGRDRRPPVTRGRLRRQFLLQDLPRGGQVHRAGRLAPGHLHRPVYQLLHVAPGTDLLVVLGVAAEHSALVRAVLQPVNVLAAGAGELALLGHGRQAGEDQDRHPAPRRVVDRPAEVLGAAVDVHQDRLRFAAHLRVPVGGAQRHELVRAQDQLGQRVQRSRALRVRVGLHDAGMVAAQVRERVPGARLPHRLKERRGRGVRRAGHDVLPGARPSPVI